jgi:tetratricopeptide (TPR) repeat protein
MVIPDFEISENTDNVIRENDEMDKIEDIENISTEEFLNDMGAIILQIAEEGGEEWQRSTKYRIFDDCENLKIPESTDYIGAFRTRGIVYTNLGEFDKALNDFNEIIRIKLYVLKKLQDYYESEKNNSFAKFNVLKLLVYYNLAFDYVRRGIVYSKIKQYDSAFKDLEIAINLNFSLLTYKQTKKGFGAGSIHNEGQFNEIIDFYNSYIEANPNDAYAYACRGFCLKYNYYNNNKPAVKDFSNAVNLTPDLHFAYYMRGHCHAAEYRFDKAIEDFNRAISIKPDHAYYFISRGRIYYNLKEFGKTIEDFKTAIQINPEISCFRYDDVYTPYTS